MGIRRGSISTPIIADGLVFNMDAANRASYPPQRAIAVSESGSCFNTLNTAQSGSFIADPQFITQPTSASCWAFDGVDDYIDLSSFTLNTDEAWSISLWTNLDDFSYSYPELFTLKTDESTGFVCFMGNASSYTGINFGSNANFTKFKTTGDISGDLVGAWVNIILTYNGSGKTTSSNYTIYVDGALVANTTTGTFAAAANVSKIGVGNTSAYFDGNISSVHIYNRALSPTEVLHNYNALKGRFGL